MSIELHPWKMAKREEAATAPGGRRTAAGRAAATTHTEAAATADAEAKTMAARSSWRNWKGRGLVTVQGSAKKMVHRLRECWRQVEAT